MPAAASFRIHTPDRPRRREPIVDVDNVDGSLVRSAASGHKSVGQDSSSHVRSREAALAANSAAPAAKGKGKGIEKDKDMGKGKAECKTADGKSNTKHCFAFARYGSCSRGNNCRYQRVAASPRPSSKDKSPGPSSKDKRMEVCRNFLNGCCKLGAKCRYAHVAQGSNTAAPASASSAEPKTGAKAKAAPARVLASPARQRQQQTEWILDTGTGNDLCPATQVGVEYSGGPNAPRDC